jgi:hypothetical protein
MGSRGRLTLVTALLCLIAAAPASAAKGIDARLALPSSNGYDLQFRAKESAHQHDATIAVTRGDATATYHVIPETITPRRIVASFEGFGEIDVRFHPSGVTGGGRCHPYREGRFSGRIRFEGDDGFTAVDATSAHGEVVRPPPGLCLPGLPHGRDEEPLPKLTSLTACDPARGVLYLALDGLGRRPFHVAGTFERVGAVEINRDVTGEGPVGSFRFKKDLSTARVSPTGLFSGAGSYGNRELRGDLAVALPGLAEPVPLAAPRAKLSDEGEVPPACEQLLAKGYSRAPARADRSR